MNKIEIKTPDRTLTVAWSDMPLFKKYLNMQRGVLTPNGDTTNRPINFIQGPDIIRNIQLFYLNYWDNLKKFKVYDDLPANPVVLDIGSGMGILDFLAYQYLDNQGKFYLVDHEEYSIPSELYSENYNYYHSWDISRDIIATSNLNPDNFIFVDNTEWPDNIDLITAWGSWCWHFSRATYWDKVKTHLKIGGRLVVEVSQSLTRPNTAEETNQELIDAISEEFQCSPKIFHMNPDGLRVMWTRNR
jgi:SAM-dependent methyltransferase